MWKSANVTKKQGSSLWAIPAVAALICQIAPLNAAKILPYIFGAFSCFFYTVVYYHFLTNIHTCKIRSKNDFIMHHFNPVPQAVILDTSLMVSVA